VMTSVYCLSRDVDADLGGLIDAPIIEPSDIWQDGFLFDGLCPGSLLDTSPHPPMAKLHYLSSLVELWISQMLYALVVQLNVSEFHAHINVIAADLWGQSDIQPLFPGQTLESHPEHDRFASGVPSGTRSNFPVPDVFRIFAYLLTVLFDFPMLVIGSTC